MNTVFIKIILKKITQTIFCFTLRFSSLTLYVKLFQKYEQAIISDYTLLSLDSRWIESSYKIHNFNYNNHLGNYLRTEKLANMIKI